MKADAVLILDTKGRLTLPLKARQAFNYEPGDAFFVNFGKNGFQVAKAENPFDDLVEYAEHERETGKSMEIRAFAKKHRIPVRK